MDYDLFDDMSGNITCYRIIVEWEHSDKGKKNDPRENILCVALREHGIPVRMVHHAIIFDTDTYEETNYVELPDDIKKLHTDWIDGKFYEFEFFLAFQYGKVIAITTHRPALAMELYISNDE